MKHSFKTAFTDTVPVMTGYLVLGFGFGIVMKAAGLSVIMTFAMSAFIYAGAMQYAAVGLLTGGASLLVTAVTTLMVNARHIFYGISMLDKYRRVGKIKPYLIFALTDETYSLVCRDNDKVTRSYCIWVSLLDHLYWVTGSVAGAVAGSLLTFNSEGVDFALTALFLTVFLEQWLSTKHHSPALIGVGATVVCRLIFGAEHFLIPAMLIIAAALCLMKEVPSDDE